MTFGAKQFTPSNDFVVSFARQTDDGAEVSAYVPSWGEFKGGGLDGAARGAEGGGYFALRVNADLPAGMTPAHVRRDRAIVIDTSHSQSKETLEGEAKLAAGLVRQLDVDERFVVLACDSACVTFPEARAFRAFRRQSGRARQVARRLALPPVRPTLRALCSTLRAVSSRMARGRWCTSETVRRRPVS